MVDCQRGNLQDAINANSINNTHFSETEMLRYFKGTCEAIRAMHDYRAPVGSNSEPFPSRANQSSSRHAPSLPNSPRHSEDDEDEMFPHPEGDGEGGYSYHGPGSGANVPLMTRDRPEDEHEAIFDGDEELNRMQHEGANGNAQTGQTELVPYAHRDLKPGYVLFSSSRSQDTHLVAGTS